MVCVCVHACDVCYIIVIEVDGSVQSAIGSIVNVYNNGSSFGVSSVHVSEQL